MFNLLESLFLGRLNIIEHDAINFSLIWEYLLNFENSKLNFSKSIQWNEL